MNKAMKMMKDFIADESGATSLEYGLIGVLVGIAMIAGISTLAKDSDSLWSTVSNSFGAV